MHNTELHLRLRQYRLDRLWQPLQAGDTRQKAVLHPAIFQLRCVYPTRFWRDQNLSGAITSDAGVIRATADNSPPSGSPAILLGFIEGTAARDRLWIRLVCPYRHPAPGGHRDFPGMERQDGRCSALRRGRRPGSTGGSGLSRKELGAHRARLARQRGTVGSPTVMSCLLGWEYARGIAKSRAQR
jgi:hypothetical protein